MEYKHRATNIVSFTISGSQPCSGGGIEAKVGCPRGGGRGGPADGVAWPLEYAGLGGGGGGVEGSKPS